MKFWFLVTLIMLTACAPARVLMKSCERVGSEYWECEKL